MLGIIRNKANSVQGQKQGFTEAPGPGLIMQD